MPLVVLLDLTLRGMNGFEVLRWMLAEPEGTMPPVIVFSYSRQETDVRRATELGANCFISKPVNPEGAVALIHSMDNFLAEAAPKTSPAPAEVLSTEIPASSPLANPS
jgi:DNA-binding response OmpR family regulator